MLTSVPLGLPPRLTAQVFQTFSLSPPHPPAGSPPPRISGIYFSGSIVPTVTKSDLGDQTACLKGEAGSYALEKQEPEPLLKRESPEGAPKSTG